MFNTWNTSVFSHDETQILDFLGKGADASVYSAMYHDKKYAVKIYKLEDWSSKQSLLDMIEGMVNIHVYISSNKQCVSLHGVSFSSDKNMEIYLYMDLVVSMGDLYDYLQNIMFWRSYREKPENIITVYNKERKLYWEHVPSKKQKEKIMYSSLSAIRELHESQVIHGDIKSSNFILENGKHHQTIKLIDFGVSEICKGKPVIHISQKRGTHGYMAPEQYNNIICYASDIYSWGVTMIEVWVGDIWESGDNFKVCRNEVLYGLRKIEKLYPELGNILRLCVTQDFERRPSIEKIKNSLAMIADIKYLVRT